MKNSCIIFLHWFLQILFPSRLTHQCWLWPLCSTFNSIKEKQHLWFSDIPKYLYMCLEKGVLDTICCQRVIAVKNLSICQYSVVALLTLRWGGTANSCFRDLSAPELDNITTVTTDMQVVYNFGDSTLYFQDVLKAFQMYPHFSAFPYVPSWLFWELDYNQEILLPLHNA